MIITFCGHSEIFGEEGLKEKLSATIEENARGEVTFYLGGYGTFDGMALCACREYKAAHPSARIVFVTPYLDEEYLKNRDFRLRDYDEILFPEMEKTPLRYAIIKRNEWMVRQADLVIAFVDHSWGGAAKTLEYAVKHRIACVNLGKKVFFTE